MDVVRVAGRGDRGGELQQFRGGGRGTAKLRGASRPVQPGGDRRRRPVRGMGPVPCFLLRVRCAVRGKGVQLTLPGRRDAAKDRRRQQRVGEPQPAAVASRTPASTAASRSLPWTPAARYRPSGASGMSATARSASVTDAGNSRSRSPTRPVSVPGNGSGPPATRVIPRRARPRPISSAMNGLPADSP